MHVGIASGEKIHVDQIREFQLRQYRENLHKAGHGPVAQARAQEEEEEEFIRIHGYYRGTQGARCYTDGASLQPDESEGCYPVSVVVPWERDHHGKASVSALGLKEGVGS